MVRLLKYSFVLLIVFVIVLITVILPKVREAGSFVSMSGKSSSFVYSIIRSYSLSTGFGFPTTLSSSAHRNTLVPGWVFLSFLTDSEFSGIHLNGKGTYNTALSLDHPSLSVRIGLRG